MRATVAGGERTISEKTGEKLPQYGASLPVNAQIVGISFASVVHDFAK